MTTLLSISLVLSGFEIGLNQNLALPKVKLVHNTFYGPLTPLPHVMVPSHPSPMSWSPHTPPPCHGPLPHVMVPSHPSPMSWSPNTPPPCHGPLTPLPHVMVPSHPSPMSWSPPPCHGPLTPLPHVMVP